MRGSAGGYDVLEYCGYTTKWNWNGQIGKCVWPKNNRSYKNVLYDLNTKFSTKFSTSTTSVYTQLCLLIYSAHVHWDLTSIYVHTAVATWATNSSDWYWAACRSTVLNLVLPSAKYLIELIIKHIFMWPQTGWIVGLYILEFIGYSPRHAPSRAAATRARTAY